MNFEASTCWRSLYDIFRNLGGFDIKNKFTVPFYRTEGKTLAKCKLQWLSWVNGQSTSLFGASFTDFHILDTQAGDRQVGRKAQLSNITAAKTYVWDMIPHTRLSKAEKLQSSRYHTVMSGTQGYAEDAIGSNGRHSAHEWWPRYITRNRSCTSSRKEHDWAEPDTRWRGGWRNHDRHNIRLQS